MQHYVATKQSLRAQLDVPDSRVLVLLYRVGDFFESFFEDAVQLASTCDIALTSKDAGKALGTRVPMAGVPHYAVDDKIRMLLEKNVTVAIVDQVQTAADTPSGKLVKRAVTRLITPGTACDDALLQSNASSYIASLVIKQRHDATSQQMQCHFGFSYADVSTGEFRVTDGTSFDELRRLLATLTPAEVLLALVSDEPHFGSYVASMLSSTPVGIVSRRDLLSLVDAEHLLADLHHVDNVESLGCRARPFCTHAAATLVQYIQQTAAFERQHLKSTMPLNTLQVFSTSDVMLLDAACLKNLEVVETARDGIRERSLQWALDRTVTPMGARCLRSWLLAPSLDLKTIRKRQGIVLALLCDTENVRLTVQEVMRSLADLERLGGRMCTGRATPREMRWLCESVLRVPSILSLIAHCVKENPARDQILSHGNDINHFFSCIDEKLLTVALEVKDALVNPAPSYMPSMMAIQSGGISKENWDINATRIFCDGYNADLDRLRKAIREPESWISALEEQERQRTSVDALRIKHIKNMGYVLRIPRSLGEKIMDDDPLLFSRLGYDRVQSTKAELRFRCDELRRCERAHNSAFGEVLMLELRLFEDLRKKIVDRVQQLREMGRQVAVIDVLAGFAQVTEERSYVQPEILPASARLLELESARHPVVEQTLPIGKSYVPNSFSLGDCKSSEELDLMILCGPNAAGKSCALRSIGLISIMAQVGCFVPARSARLSISDRIFTRVGAVDDLARGQSTFQVEMAETACILSNVTASSLVLLDEIGRGTSTVDGVAIAWSVAEYLARGAQSGNTKARTVFVTHYHELNHLSSIYNNIGSYHLHVVQERPPIRGAGRNTRDGWISTYRVMEGASFESLGLAIAERAGFPDEVMTRARYIASLLHIPSKAIGTELRTALAGDRAELQESEASLNREKSWASTGVSEEALMEAANESYYENGFNDGYNKALSELRSEFDRILDHKKT